jgi:hypothetical protein
VAAASVSPTPVPATADPGVAATMASAAPAVAARAPARPAPLANTPPKKPEGKVTTVVTASGGKWTTTVAEAPGVAPDAPSAPSAAAPVPDKTLASPAAAVASTPRAEDADVKLLSALLAHVSRTGPGVPLADDDQLTLAQVVKRCDARPAAEVRECRRRICEGYWGKAEACPAPAAPARKG